MVNEDVSDMVTDSSGMKTKQRQVQSQGRVDIPDDWLDELVGVGEGDQVHLVAENGDGSVKIMSTETFIEKVKNGDIDPQ